MTPLYRYLSFILKHGPLRRWLFWCMGRACPASFNGLRLNVRYRGRSIFHESLYSSCSKDCSRRCHGNSPRNHRFSLLTNQTNRPPATFVFYRLMNILLEQLCRDISSQFNIQSYQKYVKLSIKKSTSLICLFKRNILFGIIFKVSPTKQSKGQRNYVSLEGFFIFWKTYEKEGKVCL